MIAKVRTVQVHPDDVQRGVDYLAGTMLPMARSVPGFHGMLGLVDRATGTALTVTLWTDDEALRASEAGGARLRAGGGAPPSAATVQRFEVVVQELPASV